MNPKLLEMMNELKSVVEALTSPEIMKAPMNAVSLAKQIEKGERRIGKEYAKRLEQIATLQMEIAAIAQFADAMGYTLTNTDEPTEEPTDETNE